jgi:hypothetical protein
MKNRGPFNAKLRINSRLNRSFELPWIVLSDSKLKTALARHLQNPSEIQEENFSYAANQFLARLHHTTELSRRLLLPRR